MITVPVSTVEKPLTAIDYIAILEQCQDARSLTEYANAVPPEVVEDDRFAKAFKRRLDAIKDQSIKRREHQ